MKPEAFIPTTPNILTIAPPCHEVIRIDADGRIWWKGREVESDDDFRAAMRDVRDALCPKAVQVIP